MIPDKKEIIDIIQNNMTDNLICRALEMRPEEITKFICGLANVEGGYVLIGVERDNGVLKVKGFQLAFDTKTVMDDVSKKLKGKILFEYGHIYVLTKNVFAIKVEKAEQNILIDDMCYCYKNNSIEVCREKKKNSSTLFISYTECDAPIVDIIEKKISEIQAAREKFRETETYVTEAMGAAVKSGVSVAAGVAGGAAVASMAPSAAMWVATTFGTASTGTAISALHGAVATKAALAWLGGGALSAGGAGVAGGQALLALAGPIGWGITGVTTAASAIALGHKNKKIADEAIAEAKKITIAGAEVNETTAKIQHLTDETVLLMDALRDMAQANRPLKGSNYLELSEDKQYRLGTMVNNTLTLAELLNKTI